MTVAFTSLLVLPGAAVASGSCNKEDEITTCKGDVYPYVEDVGPGDDDTTARGFVFEELNKDATNGGKDFAIQVYSLGSEGDNDGDNGQQGRDISSDFNGVNGGSTYGINSTESGIQVSSVGGRGHDGKNRSGDDDTGGGDAGDGGLAGEPAIEHTSGDITANFFSIQMTSEGGAGADGGEGQTTSGTGSGGKGGDGGDAAPATTLVFDGNESIAISGGFIEVLSTGGEGGEGGKGKSDAGKAEGGHGGQAGDGGEIGVIFNADVAFTQNTADEIYYGFVFASSAGGKGDHGGNAGGTADSSYGGNGGVAGNGGDIDIQTNSVSISATSLLGTGIFASSTGGQGGNGGDGDSSLGSAKGGDGRYGGTGGTVKVDVSLAADGIGVSGTQAYGIFAQSIGGAGGDGGSGSGGLGSGSGGAGSGSGPGGQVTVTVSGSGGIATTGSEGVAIIAQSLGGFSGDAGKGTGLAAYGAGSQSAGAGGGVTVTIGDGNAISTTGGYADGIFAQSVGGGGGRGSSGDGLTAMGGSGSAGGNGGTVKVTTGTSTIKTSGTTSYGIQAQSLGGGGGAAGSSGGVVAWGGSAGSGGDGGAVTVTNYAGIQTTGTYSVGIMAQSAGGGGGTAHSTSASFQSVGGSGGSGGDAADATVINYAAVSTTQDDATGVIVQSIGGGGGHGSNAISAGAEYSAAYGGSGGSGGDGATATYDDQLTVAANISTEGDRARGIVVQSKGGGGGHGGYAIAASAGFAFDLSMGASGDGANGGHGGTVSVSVDGAVSTGGDQAPAITAQSTGGGGGSAGTTISSANANGISASVALGGSGGSGGNGGAVTVTVGNDITTVGDNSDGILAQSTGGGGGASGLTIAANAVSSIGLDLGIGGQGGPGGNGGNVTVTMTGTTLDVQGDGSDGIVAQSLGGAGGVAKAVIAASGASSTESVNLAIGGDGGSGGSAGTVTVNSRSNITADGDNGIGIMAQSLGGGGGHGSVTMTGAVSSNNTVGVSIGGDGGDGGDGGNVTVSLNENGILTKGSNGYGILAQSVGGNGGNGGLSIAGSGVSGADTSVSVSGSGTAGGTAGTVIVTAAAGTSIATIGQYAAAIKATSHGGGGGHAVGAISGSAGSTGAVTVSVGGTGGNGGTGGFVEVTSAAQLTTDGDDADAIYVSSHGGGGGHGAFAASGSLTAGEYSGSASVSVGGGGGAGGGAGDVLVTTTDTNGSIYTTGYKSRGMMVQSVGGSGGYGGYAYAGNLTLSEEGGIDMSAAIGGGGGNGGIAGDVTVENAQSITTKGDYADGMFVQSVGGDGGYGGNAYLYIANVTTSSSANVNTTVGGAGGSGNTGGTVDVYNAGAIRVVGYNASGIYAQSTGGGGGRAGSAGSIVFSLTRGTPKDDTNVTGNFTTNVGGAGGSGHHGGAVTVRNFADIEVNGTGGYGIFAQSVGGGGGDGGNVSGDQVGVQGNGCTFSISLLSVISCTGASDQKSTYSLDFNLEIGGDGGSGGDGDDVTVVNRANITTIADTTFGIFAQSTGGGGGVGGNAALGSESALPHNMITKETNYFADFAGEFLGNFRTFQTAKVVIGGNGGAAGDGGDVTVTNSGIVTTKGDYSDAIHAHSVGGGGGHGGTGNLGFGSLISFALGGQGGAGGNGGDVTVTSRGEVVTEGDDAIGIFAQSVGGGGGRAGNITRVLETVHGQSFNLGKGVGVQLSGGNGGNGGDVSVTVGGDGITSSGDYAHGVWAQSTGGSGGAAHIGSEGTSVAVSFAGGNGAAPGNSGTVDVTVNAPITVSGTNSFGIFAQSASGTKGAGQGGNSGDVTITVNDDVTATGTDSGAMILQSDAYDSVGTVSVTIARRASVSSAADGGNTITIQDGKNNTITNNGTIAMAETSSSEGYAVQTFNAGLTITNNGTFEGSVSLEDFDPYGDAVDNVFTNADTLGLGRTFDLGYKTSTLTNEATMSAGTVGSVGASDISGTVTQTADGTLHVDIDIDDGYDAITISGGKSATFAGTVAPNFINNLPETGDSDALSIVTSSVGLTSTDLTVSDTATVGYTLSQTTDDAGDDELQLTYLVDYTPWDPASSSVPGATGPDASGYTVNDNDTAVGNYVDTLVALRRADIASGANEYGFIDDFVFELLALDDIGTLLEIYEHMTPSDVMATAQGMSRSALGFADSLMSCPGRDDDGVALFGEEGSCFWAHATGITRHVERNGTSPGYTGKGVVLSGGAQFEVRPDWFLGVALGYETYVIDTSFSDGDGDMALAGAVLKKVIGNTTIAGSLSGGIGTVDLTRDILSGFETTGSTADTNPSWVAGHVRASHRFDVTERAFIEPLIDGGVTAVHVGGFTIAGGYPFDLDVSGTSAMQYSVNPAARLGSTFKFGNVAGEVSVRGGVMALLGDRTFETTVSAQPLGPGGAGFTATTDSDSLLADLGLALEASITDALTVKANIDSLVGAHEQRFAAGLRLNLSF